MIRTAEYKIIMPEINQIIDQDEEWVTMECGGKKEKVRLHDYARIYSIPGFYEEVIYKRLKCDSPRIVCDMLKAQMDKAGSPVNNCNVLDFGAGNGIVGEWIKKVIDCNTLVGLDIIPEARRAAYRDKPNVYDNYFILDLANLSTENQKKLMDFQFDVLVTVAALGFDDIPSMAFINAFNILKPGSYVAFNIKDRFFSDNDTSGFRNAINSMTSDGLNILETKRYCHRMSINGEPLHYIAVVGKKI